MMDAPIYAPWNSGLGDQWATINLLMNRARQTGRTSYLHSPANLRQLHTQILGALSGYTWGCEVELTADAPTVELSGYDVWAADYIPTIQQWDNKKSHRHAVYHFDGLSSASDKNPSAVDHELLLNYLGRSGFIPVAWSPSFSVEEMVKVLADSAFFVGVDSGPSHVAHSVGLPVFLLEYKLPIVTCHRGKPYIHCQGTEDFTRHKLPTWIDYQRFIGHPDGERSTVPRDRKFREAIEKSGVRWWRPT